MTVHQHLKRMFRAMDSGFIRQAIDGALQRGLTVEDALAHWQLAGGAEAGAKSALWVSVGFGIARAERAGLRYGRS